MNTNQKVERVSQEFMDPFNYFFHLWIGGDQLRPYLAKEVDFFAAILKIQDAENR